MTKRAVTTKTNKSYDRAVHKDFDYIWKKFEKEGYKFYEPFINKKFKKWHLKFDDIRL